MLVLKMSLSRNSNLIVSCEILIFFESRGILLTFYVIKLNDSPKITIKGSINKNCSFLAATVVSVLSLIIAVGGAVIVLRSSAFAEIERRLTEMDRRLTEMERRLTEMIHAAERRQTNGRILDYRHFQQMQVRPHSPLQRRFRPFQTTV